MPSHKRFQPKSRDYSVPQPKQAKATKPSKPSKPSKSEKSSQPSPTADSKPSLSPEELASQQKLLTVFESAFDDIISSPDFSQTLQEVKKALFDRDFERAFGSERYLDVYAARWSATRVLGYAAIFDGLRETFATVVRKEHFENQDVGTTVDTAGASDCSGSGSGTAEKLELLSIVSPEDTPRGSGDGSGEPEPAVGTQRDVDAHKEQRTRAQSKRKMKVLALGGGVAELAAFASFLADSEHIAGEMVLLDTGPWGGLTSKLYTALTALQPLPKYASASANAANAPLVTCDRLKNTFVQSNILTLSPKSLREMLGTQPLLVTILFTLNELYTTAGIARTTSFLRNLSREIPPGSLLLVVDSPGSYSEAAVGKGGEDAEKKKYPMSWLVDHTLLRIGEKTRRQKTETEGAEGATGTTAQERPDEDVSGCKWEKLEEDDSVWFRVSDSLQYPIQLENMRYQIHLYRSISIT